MTQKVRILLVEDEEALVAGLSYSLEREGYDVLIARDGAEALDVLQQGAPDLVLLDVMLPKRSGFDVLSTLRREGRTLPVILLTAKGQEADKVKGLDLGADDYVTKPFALAELMARIRAGLRRHAMDVEDVPDGFELGPVRIDLRAMQAIHTDGPAHELSVREVDMLSLLWRERGRPVSRERFLDEIWGSSRFPTTRTVDQHVAKLRQKVERDPANPQFLRTAFGVGYRLETP